jgi:phosphatidylinositol kinase/protein kinase (PI-3  family)
MDHHREAIEHVAQNDYEFAKVHAMLAIADAITETSKVKHLEAMLDARPEVNIITTRSGKEYITLKFSDGTMHEYAVTDKKVHK